MAPAPLAPVRDDPAFIEAQALQTEYANAAQAARQDFNATDIARATRVVKLWKTVVTRMVELRQDLNARRRARIEWIETQLPVGPGITAGTTAADRVVLLAAFNNAHDKAKHAAQDDRETMLANAERFGDDVTRRAVLTAAIDDSQWPLVDGWAAKHATETGALLVEWRDLRSLVAGMPSTDALFASQAFRTPQRPTEWHTLLPMVQAHNAAAIEHNRSPGRGNAPARPIIDLGDLLTPPTGLR